MMKERDGAEGGIKEAEREQRSAEGGQRRGKKRGHRGGRERAKKGQRANREDILSGF